MSSTSSRTRLHSNTSSIPVRLNSSGKSHSRLNLAKESGPNIPPSSLPAKSIISFPNTRNRTLSASSVNSNNESGEDSSDNDSAHRQNLAEMTLSSRSLRGHLSKLRSTSNHHLLPHSNSHHGIRSSHNNPEIQEENHHSNDLQNESLVSEDLRSVIDSDLNSTKRNSQLDSPQRHEKLLERLEV